MTHADSDKGDDIFGSEIFPLIPSLLMSPRKFGQDADWGGVGTSRWAGQDRSREGENPDA